MPASRAEIVVLGAGIAGVAAAARLAVCDGIRDIVLVDARPPLSLTSDKSTEAYRNWWPGPDDAMVRFMNRSIDLLEEIARATTNRIRLNRRGYLYATADPARAAAWSALGVIAAGQGAGALRSHRGEARDPHYIGGEPFDWTAAPTGADLFLDPGLVRQHFPYLTPDTVAVLHARRCGWFSGQQLGMFELERAQAHGVRLVRGEITGIDARGGRVHGVRLATAAGNESIATGCLVAAPGPLFGPLASWLGIDLPIFCELHRKIAFEDRLGVIPRDAPLVIWDDAVTLPWSDAERETLGTTAETQALLRPFPAGAHFRPEGGRDAATVLALWAFDTTRVEPQFPLPEDAVFPEIVLRGLCRWVPGFAAYLQHLPRPYVDGGYYTKTRDNRPLIGPLPIAGAFCFGALSGYGLMAASAGAELLAAHVTGTALPDYAAAFRLERFADAAYLERLAAWGDAGQL